MDKLTLCGLFIIVFLTLKRLLDFYGVGPDVYGVYVVFYVFLIILTLVL